MPLQSAKRPSEPTSAGTRARSPDGVAPTVPDHELFQRIGSGAYGEVWLARNLATGALRAAKIVYRSTFADERPFNREFEGIKKFDAVSRSHPSQLALFHVGRNDADGYFYYVMELADDRMESRLQAVSCDKPAVPSDLAEKENRLKAELHTHASGPHLTFNSEISNSYTAHTLRADLEHGRLPAARVLQLALTLSEALAHLHAHSLIHRDIKPSNIIFVGGRPKLADIGLVTDASDSRSIVGTEGYLAPEGPGTPAADLFALGKVVYEALTGHDRRQYPELPADLRQWPDAKLAFELNTIFLKACAVSPRERYQCATEMLADLKFLDSGKSINTRRSLHRAWSLAWKASAAFALAAALPWLFQSKKTDTTDGWKNSGTTNFAAWQAHQLALQMADPYTVQTMSNSVKELERAVQLDPNFAGGWGTLALGLSLAVDYGYLNGRETLPRAKSHLEKAIQLNPNPASKYCILAEIRLALDYDFPSVEPIYRKGLAALPSTSIDHHNFARVLIYYGRFDEAEKILRNIIDKNPGAGGSYILLGQVYGASGRFEEALAAYQKAIPTSNRPYLYFNRADLFASRNDRPAAARDLLRFIELHGFASLDPLNEGASLRLTLNERGPEDFLRRHIELLEARRAEGQFVSSYDLARLHQHAANGEKAIDYLELSVDEHRHMALAVKVNPLFKTLHGNPRFHAVLRRFRLE